MAVSRWQGFFFGLLAPLGFLAGAVLMLLEDQGWLSEAWAKWAAGACLAVGWVGLTVALVLKLVRRGRGLADED